MADPLGPSEQTPASPHLPEELLRALKKQGIRFQLGAKVTGATVGDDGVGLPAGLDWRRPTSLGLQLVRDLVRQVHGDLQLVRRETGTRFRMRVAPG